MSTSPAHTLSSNAVAGPSCRPQANLSITDEEEERPPRRFFSLRAAAKAGRLVLAKLRAPTASPPRPATVATPATPPSAPLMTQHDPRVQHYIAALTRWKTDGVLPGRLEGTAPPRIPRSVSRKKRVASAVWAARWVASAANVGAVLDAAPAAAEGMCVLALSALALWNQPAAPGFPALWAEGVWDQTAAVVQTVCYDMKPCPIAPPLCWLGVKEMRGYFNSHIKPRTPGYVSPAQKRDRAEAAKKAKLAAKAASDQARRDRKKANLDAANTTQVGEEADGAAPQVPEEDEAAPQVQEEEDEAALQVQEEADQGSAAASSSRISQSPPIDVETVDAARTEEVRAASTESGGSSDTAVESDRTAVEPPAAKKGVKRKASALNADDAGTVKRVRVSTRVRKPTSRARANRR